MKIVALIVSTALALLLCYLRVAGHKEPWFQAAAHVAVGGFLFAAVTLWCSRLLLRRICDMLKAGEGLWAIRWIENDSRSVRNLGWCYFTLFAVMSTVEVLAFFHLV